MLNKAFLSANVLPLPLLLLLPLRLPFIMRVCIVLFVFSVVMVVRRSKQQYQGRRAFVYDFYLFIKHF